MSPNRMGFGLLGAGLVAPFHAKALQASDRARLVAVADTDFERAVGLAREFGCKAVRGLEQLLADPAVEVIDILTPNHLHYEAVMQAAASGRPVLVEKPPALSLAEVDSMKAACDAAGVTVGVVLQCRLRRVIQAVRRALEQGRFGRLYHVDAFMKWFRPRDYYLMAPWRGQRKAGAGVTIQQAFHYLDLLLYLAGPVRQVQARMRNLMHPEVELDDTLLAFLDYGNGAQGVVEASTALWPGTDLRIEINGERGTAVVVGERIETWRFQEERPEDQEIGRLGSAAVATGATGAADLGFQDHQALIEDLVDAIREGRSPAVTLPSARATLELALALYKSARDDSVVSLPLQDEAVW